MPKYFLTLILLIVTAILAILSLIIPERYKRLCKFLAVCGILVTAVSGIIQAAMPTPAFSLTNGDKVTNNQVCLDVEWPCSVYYTFTPYADPKRDGQKYDGSFEVSVSGTIRYVSNWWIFWGDIESQDIQLKEGEAEAVDEEDKDNEDNKGNEVDEADGEVSSSSISENVILNETESESELESEEPYILFKHYYLKYDNSDYVKQVQLKRWEDRMKDVAENCYSSNGLYVLMRNLTNSAQDSGDSFIDASIIYVVDYEDGEMTDTYNKHISGKIVVGENYLASQAWVSITIKVNGETVWFTGENISGITVSPVPFEFDINNDEVNEAIVTMEFHCDARGKGLGIGIIFDDNVLEGD